MPLTPTPPAHPNNANNGDPIPKSATKPNDWAPAHNIAHNTPTKTALMLASYIFSAKLNLFSKPKPSKSKKSKLSFFIESFENSPYICQTGNNPYFCSISPPQFPCPCPAFPPCSLIASAKPFG
jgi:hypothetical protein